ncbi:MAG TPA: hypothetical protein VMF52_16915 [Steroidobacteraceae bacterium]|nr:hypothetical protein [Steroidobacteraceae bacterium]
MNGRRRSAAASAAWRTMLLAVSFGHAALAQTTSVDTVTIAQLYPPAVAAALSRTLPADRAVKFHVRVPPGEGPHGVLVFVSAHGDAQPPEEWPAVLDRHDLVWVSAEGFGNDEFGAQRVLVTLMALEHVKRLVPLDRQRLYVGGMAGGGRIASQALTRFPGFFSGALCLLGADFVAPEPPLAPELAGKRVVFASRAGDANRREIRAAYSRFVDVGVQRAHLLELGDYGHVVPDGEELDEALTLLER